MRQTDSVGGRFRKHAASAGIIALALLLLTSTPALAGKKWCRADPIITLDGYAIQILVGIPQQYVAAVNGPIYVEIGTPAGVVREVLLLDAGFNGHGEVVTFKNIAAGKPKQGIPVTVTVRVPFDSQKVKKPKKVDIQVIVTQDRTREVVFYGNGQQGAHAKFRLHEVLSLTQ